MKFSISRTSYALQFGVALLLSATINAETSVTPAAIDIYDKEQQIKGASIYIERCALCHGTKGMGEGPLALLIREYPDTNLKNSKKSLDSVRTTIRFGSPSNQLSPPWQHELQNEDIAAVTAFVDLLRNDHSRAIQQLASVNIEPKNRRGQKIYRARCEQCHGAEGKGDGRMSRIYKNPPPSNLTGSSLSHNETVAIISAGGAGVGRSESMPPWGQELISSDILSVTRYLSTLRQSD